MEDLTGEKALLETVLDGSAAGAAQDVEVEARGKKFLKYTESLGEGRSVGTPLAANQNRGGLPLLDRRR